jgi:hypothetical protein
MPAQIEPVFGFGEGGLSREQSGDRVGLVKAVLQQQPAAGAQMGRCAGDQRSQIIKAIGARR